MTKACRTRQVSSYYESVLILGGNHAYRRRLAENLMGEYCYATIFLAEPLAVDRINPWIAV